MEKENLCVGSPAKAVVALGNPDRGDDGVAHHILAELPPHKGVEFLPSLKTGMDLALELLNYEKVLVIDADPSLPPGSFSLREVSAAKARTYFHGLGLWEALEVLRGMGRKIPRTWVLAIGVPPVLPFGRSLSPKVAKVLPRAREVVEAWLESSD